MPWLTKNSSDSGTDEILLLLLSFGASILVSAKDGRSKICFGLKYVVIFCLNFKLKKKNLRKVVFLVEEGF